MESGAFPDVVPFSVKKEIFENFHHPRPSETANTMESNMTMGVIETKKVTRLFSVITLSLNWL